MNYVKGGGFDFLPYVYTDTDLTKNAISFQMSDHYPFWVEFARGYRASGLNIVVAAIILWNTVYIERAVSALRTQGQQIDENLLQHLAPLGWEHLILPEIMSGSKVKG